MLHASRMLCLLSACLVLALASERKSGRDHTDFVHDSHAAVQPPSAKKPDSSHSSSSSDRRHLQDVHTQATKKPVPDRLPMLSFEPPFNEVDQSGHRMVVGYRASGSTVVTNNFVRLAPEQQSKKGALWSREPIELPSFSSVLKFRISGRAKDFYGDGIALWFVQQGYWLEGDLHGFQESFVGVGIIFDTFKNTENLAAHRDVTVLVNDGEKTWEMMTKDVKGCNNVLARYNTERADFKVTDYSMVKVAVDDRKLSVFVDPRNRGEWEECVVLDDIPLPEGWAREAHIGVTATTGQLVDNHDIISLVTYADASVVEHEEERRNKPLFELAPQNMTVTERLGRLEATMNKVLNRLEYLDHHFEHHFLTLQDHVDAVKTKLDGKEHEAEDRIKALEERLRGDVKEEVQAKISHVETAMAVKMDRKIDKFEKKLETTPDLKRKMAATSSGGGGGGGGEWKLPFFFLLVLIVGATGSMYYFYQRILRKTHLP